MKKAIAVVFVIAVMLAANRSGPGQDRDHHGQQCGGEQQSCHRDGPGSGTRFELQCNEGLHSFSTLQPGNLTAWITSAVSIECSRLRSVT